MSFITSSIKDILQIKIKPRHDNYTDQFSRIFMVKMYIVACLIVGINWYSDQVSCMVPNNSELSAAFVHSACWIQGFYVYPQMMKRLPESNYYGIPLEMDFNGQTEKGELCSLYNRKGAKNEDCFPMRKLYYLQFQYMPFFIASLALLVYMPYMLFRIVNTDMISLRETMSQDQVSSEDVSANYFNYQVNSKRRMRTRVLLTIVVKIIYVIVNVFAFTSTDALLYGNFNHYGIEYLKWSRMNHSNAFSFYDGNTPKPGNVLLPSFGFCEIQEGSIDIRNIYFNRNKFICEISSNILYQYVLLLLWTVMIAAIIISLLGFVLSIWGMVRSRLSLFREEYSTKSVLKVLTYRECQYLTFIRRKNIPLYGDILRYLKETRPSLRDTNGNFDSLPVLNGKGNKEDYQEKLPYPV